MKPTLDTLLQELRTAEVPDTLLDDVERRVWQQIAAREVFGGNLRLRLSFQIASIAAAFLLGIVMGADVSDSRPESRAFLMEEMDLLPPGSGGLLL